MRVALVSHLADLSGACRSLQTLAQQLQAQGVGVYVVLPSAGPLLAILQAREIRALVIRRDPGKTAETPRGPAFQLLSARTPAIVAGRINYALRLATLLRRDRPDVVWVNTVANSSAVAAAALARVPCVWHIREGREIALPSAVHHLRLPILRRARHVVTLSRYNRRFLESVGVSPAYITVVPNGVDPHHFHPDEQARRVTRQALSVEEGMVLVGTVQVVTSKKGTHEFVRAAAEVANRFTHARFVVVGDALGSTEDQRYFDAARDLAAQLGCADQVHFVGAQPDVRPYLAAMDIFVLPSYAESFPVSILEAMAMGKPVVASRVGAVSEMVVEQVTGLTFPAVDVTRLAEAISQLVVDTDRRTDMGQAARATVERSFTIEQTAARMIQVFDKAQHTL